MLDAESVAPLSQSKLETLQEEGPLWCGRQAAAKFGYDFEYYERMAESDHDTYRRYVCRQFSRFESAEGALLALMLHGRCGARQDVGLAVHFSKSMAQTDFAMCLAWDSDGIAKFISMGEGRFFVLPRSDGFSKFQFRVVQKRLGHGGQQR